MSAPAQLLAPEPLTQNLILKALPPAGYARLLPDLKPVHLALGQVLYRPQERIEYAYFPDHARLSVIANISGGRAAEVGGIGGEGLVGIEVLLGSNATLNEHLVQLPGGALQITAAALRREFRRAGVLQTTSLRFVRLFMFQLSQTALCNRRHLVAQRLARWLLLCHDRAATDTLPLTQEFLALMLGTRRATVTVAALALQKVGCIRYTRGRITVTDRAGLEAVACACYWAIKREYDRVRSATRLFR